MIENRPYPSRAAEEPREVFVEQPPVNYGPSTVNPQRVQHQQIFEDEAIAIQQFRGTPPDQLASNQDKLKRHGQFAPVAAAIMRQNQPRMSVEQLGQEDAKLEYFTAIEGQEGRRYRSPLVSQALLDTLLDTINQESIATNEQARVEGRQLSPAEKRASDDEIWNRVMSNFDQAKAAELERLPDTPLLSFPAREEEPPEQEAASPSPSSSPPPSSPPPIPPGRHSSTADHKRHHGRLYPGDVPRPEDWPKARTRGGRSKTTDFKREPENIDLFNLIVPNNSEAHTEEMNVVPLPPTQEMEIPFAFPNEKHIYYEANSAPAPSVQEFASRNYDIPKQLVTVVAQPGAELDMDRHPHTRNLDERQIIVTDAEDNQYFISGRMELNLKDIFRNGVIEGQNWHSVGNLGVLRIGQPMRRADGTMTDRPIKRVEFVSGAAASKDDLGDYVKRRDQNPFTKNNARLRAAFAAINHRTRRAANEQPTEEHNGSDNRRGPRAPRPEDVPPTAGGVRDFNAWRSTYNDAWRSVFDAMFRRSGRASTNADDGPSIDWEAPQQPAPLREEPNPYDVLGVNNTASDAEIKKAFRRIANTNHPDIGGDEEKFKEITAAYDILVRPAQREYYDQHSTMEGYNGNTQ